MKFLEECQQQLEASDATQRFIINKLVTTIKEEVLNLARRGYDRTEMSATELGAKIGKDHPIDYMLLRKVAQLLRSEGLKVRTLFTCGTSGIKISIPKRKV
jgi:hypothetical protein